MKLMLPSFVDTFLFHDNKAAETKLPTGRVILFSQVGDKKMAKLITSEALPWVDTKPLLERPFVYLQTNQGPLWLIACRDKKNRFAFWRDSCGELISHFQSHNLQSVRIDATLLAPQDIRASILGFELGAYQYRAVSEDRPHQLPQVFFLAKNDQATKSQMSYGRDIGKAMNISRHLINTPANQLNTLSYSQLLKGYFQKIKNVEVEVWDDKKLSDEGCGLLVAVGQGSANPSRLVKISYRPQGSSQKKSAKGSRANSVNPVVFVGKGVVFDTGGLDIKPSAGMRHMKKDMGGSACVVGLADFVIRTKLPIACDFYIALAENSVSGSSFRPGDIFKSKSGIMVEIDNTDAEGRLILADALTLACEQPETPEVVIDMATLTGACRVALGTEIGGLMANDSILARRLQNLGTEVGDLVWELPLHEKYFSSYHSSVADFKNSGDGMGGAITAGLFLQKFVKAKSWAHFDVYCWNDRVAGAQQSPGGHASGVSLLAHYLLGKAKVKLN